MISDEYRIHPKYSGSITPDHTYSKICTSLLYYLSECLKTGGRMANSVDPYQTPRSAASDLGLQCLLGHVYVHISSKYGASVIRIEHKRTICRHQEIEFLVLGIKQDTTFLRESLINNYVVLTIDRTSVHVTLKELDILGRFPAIFHKGDNFCDFLWFPADQFALKSGLS